MSNKKPQVAVFFGGTTESSDLSQETGYWVCNYIPRTKYRVTPVRVTADGNWQVPLGGLPQHGPVDRMMNMLFTAVPALPPAQALERLLRDSPAAMMTTIRGQGGDDGTLQSLGTMLRIPVVGAPASTCQQTFHKELGAKQVAHIVNTPLSLFFPQSRDLASIADDVRRYLAFPLFVKPASEESSVGVEEITQEGELLPALQRVKAKGDMLVQERAEGVEVTLTLIQDDRGELHVLPPTVIVPKKTAFYDQLAKRRAGRVLLHTADDTHNPLLWEAETIARDVYEQLGCRGYASLDMVSNNGSMELLEVNTVPTLTQFTPLKHQLHAAGLHPSKMLDSLITHTLETGN